MTDNLSSTNSELHSNTDANISHQNNILNTIKELQESEKNLYNMLTSKTPITDPDEIQSTINKINNLSQTRIDLYKNLGSSYSTIKSNVQDSQSDLIDQMTFTKMMEGELNSTKGYINEVKNNKNNKLRMVEINTYYGKRYQAHIELMQMIIVICIPFLVLSILTKKGLLQNNTLINYITAILIIIAVFVLGAKIFDISRRNNMSFDEYNWFFNPDVNDPTVYQYDNR